MRRHGRRFEDLTLAAVAALAWLGLALQLWVSVDVAVSNGRPAAQGVTEYFGFFTVLTNLLVALMASVGLLAPGLFTQAALLRGTLTTAILFVGLAYHYLLRSLWHPEGWQLLADGLLDYAVPLAALASWVLFPPRTPAPTAPLVWCAYPCGYFVYVLVRGALIGSYPYYFLDVTTLGYGDVLVNGVGLLGCFIALGFLVRYLTGFTLAAPGTRR